MAEVLVLVDHTDGEVKKVTSELLTLAGLVAKPERHDLVKMAKAFRRAEREAVKA